MSIAKKFLKNVIAYNDQNIQKEYITNNSFQINQLMKNIQYELGAKEIEYNIKKTSNL